ESKDIGYVETHGTGTPLGDPLEIAALQRAYGLGAEHKGTIPIASVKTNIGHLDTAAGLVGLIKAALVLHHGEIPPSLHFEQPNPSIDFDAGPFFVNTALREWKRGPVPRRAGVSSFGIGGTNAHAILEEAPEQSSEPSLRAQQVVLLSARTPAALDALGTQLAAHVEANPHLTLADVASTHALGRRGFEHRRAVVARDAAELVQRLRKPGAAVALDDVESGRRLRVAFLFPGQGAQQVAMGRELYQAEPDFRAHVDTCLGLLEMPLRDEVRTLLLPEPNQEATAKELLSHPRVALPALFTVEYSLARTWMGWGVTPHALLGHSYGEYVAACLAGVFSLADALRLAVTRGQLMEGMAPGAMLAVGLSEGEVRPLLSGRLSLAALNAPGRCVISGPIAEVEHLTEELKRRDVGTLRLPAAHAFHSADVEPFMPELLRVVASLERSAPKARLVSSLTGTWATAEEVMDPGYWARQMRQPVRFASGVEALLSEGCSLLLEVGPGQDLTALVRANLDSKSGKVKALPSLRRQGSSASEHAVLLQALGDTWAHGLSVDWKAFYARERRLRLSLPTYPFQEKRCWVDDVPTVARPATALPIAPAATAVTPSTPAVPVAPVAAPAVVPAGREDMPRGDIEERVAALWRARLGLEYVGRDDSFLELGGNSLLAAQMLTQMRDTFGVNLPLADLFDSPTVAGIAARIEALLQSAPQQQQTQQKTLALAPLTRDGELRLSYVQERTWRLEQFLPGLSAYNIPFVLRLESALDARLLERAIQEVVQRHEVLRTTYDTVDGRPVPSFHAKMHVPLEVLVLDGTPEEREAEAMRLAREDAARPFDLVKGPLLRTTLLRLREDVHVLMCTHHHIVSDTLSVLIFVQEMAALYVAMSEGKPSPLPALPLQYADFGHWQLRNVSENLFAEQQQWWRQRLAGMPPRLNLPTDRPRPAICPLTSERMSVDFPSALANEMVVFGRREGFTSYIILLAAWQALLHRYSGQTDIVVGTPIANRTRPELQSLIGYVAHSVALRTDLSGDPTFRELLARVREVLLGAQNHPDVPFEQLVEELLPQHDIGRGRMTDSVFVLHTAAGNPQQMPGLRAHFVEVPGTPVQWGTTLSDLTLVLQEEPGKLGGALEYATELFDASTARRILEHLRVLLTAGLARPDERISRLPLLTGEERQQWLQPQPTPTSPTVPELLARRAESTPGAVAVVRDGRTWTLGELMTRSRSLAARLHALGVKHGEPVVVCLEPSPEKLLALWGVMEAGASVVTLAPSELGSLPHYAPEGASAPVLLTWRGLVTAQRLEPSRVLHVESLEDAPASAGAKASVRPEDPAWLLPAGASQPAWVLSHGGLLHLFDTLDARLKPSEGSTWLAAAENAVERPELEWLWALSRGLRVLFPSQEVSASLLHLRGENVRSRAVDLSLMFFANDEDAMRGSKYELLMEAAKFADANGFSAVWTPERHFHAFGGIYPQPALLASAVAAVTRNLGLRAGSVVLPLHDPLLVAEQWSVADNLSNGRVGVSVATGWHVQDFSYAPHNYENRRNILLENLKTLRAVWRGEKLKRRGGGGVEVEVGLRPLPVQRELPIWLTATSNPETFRMAGELGAGVLTGLFAHSFEELKAKVGLYREAWRRNGHPGRGHITAMLHTFIGDDDREVLETVHKPLLGYFRGSVDIVASLAALQGFKGDIAKVPEADIQVILERGFEHYAYHAGLIGSVESGVKRLEEVRLADVDEVACLIDFGLDTPTVMQGLRKLAEVRQRGEELAAGRQEQVLVESRQGVDALVELARSSGGVMMHASARLARTLSELPDARRALEPVKALVLEESSAELARALQEAAGVPVLRRSVVADGSLVPRTPEEELPSEVQRWVLDESGQPVPSGVVGELALYGAGLPQNLWRASSEDHQRWVPHPLSASERLYRTGRYVRMRTDGGLEPMSAPPARARRPAAVVPAAPPAGASTPPPIPHAPRNEPLPLSFAQQRLWYLQQFEPTSAAYNNGVAYRLSGPLDVSALQSALREVVHRHEALRTTYTLTEQGAIQLIHPGIELSIPLVEPNASTSEARESEALRLCREHLLLPFDLEKGPVLRALLVRLETEEHILSLVFHHIVSDAWSSLVLADELVALYTAFCAGQPSPLPPMALQYADFAVWQRKWLEGAVMESEIVWWKQRLAGVPPLELPTDKPRPAVQAQKGAQHPFLLPRELSEPLLALGRREGSTSFMVMMALFQTLLSRYSGQEDFAVGLPTAGRHHPGTEGLIGCFINTLAVRASLDGAPSFRQLLTRVRRASLETLAHQELPFERLVDALQVHRDLSRSPVFQVLLNVVNVPPPQAEMAALRLNGVKINSDTTKFDLTLEVLERSDGLYCTFEYATELFEPSTVVRMAGHLAVLARQVVETPEKPLAELTLLSQAERQQVLVEWNQTQTDYPRHGSIHGHFEAQARLTPDAIAVQEGEQRLTYRELDERANQLAWHLRSLGVGTEAMVGLLLERSTDMVVAMLATLKAGGAYLPLDTSYPSERLAFMLQDSCARVLITRQSLQALLPSHSARLLLLDSESSALAQQPRHAPPSGAGSDNLAYLIYTSGSTGRPKGVAVPHLGVLRLVLSTNYIRFTPEDCVAHASNTAFDAATFEVWGALLSGARLLILSREQLLSPHELGATLRAHSVSTLFLTTALFNQFASLEPSSFSSLRDLVVGGDAIDVTSVRRVLEAAPPARLVNGYGPTESTTFAICYLARSVAPHASSIPIGSPISNTTAFVLDEHLQPVPPGVPGELYLGGDGLARGYFGRPELTAERFIPHPFSSSPGARLYRTGDKVRWLENGEIEFLGRLDSQVKLRGFRIELGEIESALRAHPSVRQAIVVVRQDSGDKRLVAYVVPTSPRPPGEGRGEGSAALELNSVELSTFLKGTLPEYMVPSAFVSLESLPLTPNGKVDTKALPAPETSSLQSAAAYVAPRNELEQRLADIWAQVLHTERVGIHDNFFELGGHSLLATQVVSRIRSAFQVELPLRALFEAPTVSALAAHLGSALQSGAALQAPPLTPADTSGPLPLSFSQLRLWFIDQLQPGSSAYNMPYVLRLEGALDEASLQRAFTELVRRHHSLRTTFGSEAGQPVQRIAPSASLPLSLVDLSSLPPSERQEEARRLASHAVMRPFDLAHGPLLHASLFKLEAQLHLLALSMHHIVSDGWSMGILVREMAALYQAFSSGQPSPLPELPLQYADYAVWQRNWLQGSALEQQLDWWRHQLADAPSALELPTDKPRPSVQSHRGALVEVHLPKELSESLKAFCQREGVTPFMTLLAAFQVLLSRYSGQDDISVGSPIAGRRHSELEGLIGFFVNTLVLRARLAGVSTFHELLHQVRETTLGAFAHQDIPFEKLVEELQPPRDLSRSPLFQVMFALQNAPQSTIDLPGLSLRPLMPDEVASKFDLILSLVDNPEGFFGTLEYCAELFEHDTVARMAEHLAELARQVVESPEKPLAQLTLLSQAERQRVLVEWNQTRTDYPRHGSIHGHFEAQARLTPDAIALQEGARTLTYRELDERANQLAWHLRSLGVGTEAMVGLLLERSTDMVVAMLATLKAGGAYLPLDTSYPSERLAFMLEDSSARVLITLQSLQARLPSHSARLLLLDSESSALAQQPRHAPPSGSGSDNLAYLIYTSGSTGRPKGVAVPHLGVLRLVLSTNYVRFTPEDCVAHASNTAFDAATFEVWGALLSGARLVILSREQLLSPLELGATLRAHSVSTLFLTTALFNQIAALSPSSFSSLRHLLVGGEAIDVTSVRHVLEAAPPSRLLNVYGPTESTTFATWYRIQSVAPDASSVPIGSPISNTTAFVLDEHLQPVPPGVPGELYLGGDGLARGYFGRPELTAEKFIPHPFSSSPGARLYRTGDKARWLPDGQLEFLGRLDSQVKLRGFRIELGEIESALRAHPSVRQAIVVVRQDSGDKRLVAYVVPTSPRPPGEGRGEGGASPELTSVALSTFLKGTLPEYMVPSAFVSLESLPLTPNGKVDTQALPAPEASSLQSTAAYVAPRDELERRLADIWSQVLHTERIGIHDNFFELGGHSLLATQVVSRIRSAFQVELPLRALFEAPTVAALAVHLSSALQSSASLLAPSLTPANTSGPLPLSFAQQRLWFLDQLQPGSSAYNMPYVLRLEGALDEVSLQRAFAELVRRHHALRTTFASEAGQPVQRIAPTASLPLSLVDLSSLPPAERQEEARRLASHAVMRPFDLTHGPLLHASLFKLEEQLHLLALCMHHIVSDGWSMGILVREVASLYQAFSSGQPSPLSELPLQYADYAVWQRQWLQGAALEQQLSYWKQQLSGAPAALELLTDKPRPSVQSHRGAHLDVHLPKALSESLTAFCQREGVTPFMALLAAFQLLLSRYSGQDDISVGSPIAGRRHSELEGLIGFFVNTLVLRARLSGVSTFRELLHQVRETTLGAFAHQDIPFEKLVEELRPPRDLSRSPLFQVMFALQNAPHSDIDLPGLSLRAIPPGELPSKFDLTLSLFEGPEGFTGTLEYCSDLFEHHTAVRMVSHLRMLLSSVLSQPDAPLSSLSLLTGAERHQLFVEWSPAPRALPQHPLVHRLFEAQVRRAPDALALLSSSSRLSYSELNSRSNQLARLLRSLGAGPDSLVALHLERSTDFVVALLATLKAGSAWLPLDPSLPNERLSFILSDARPSLLLTHSSLDVDVPSFRMDALSERLSSFSGDDLEVTPDGDHLAYVIYTSGSTGRPKGALLHHRGLFNTVLQGIDSMRLGPDSRVLPYASTGFDASIWEMLPTLVSGGQLFLTPRDQLAPGAPLRDFLREHAINTAFFTPALLALLEPQGLESLHTVSAGGDALPPELVARWKPGRRFVNLYGPTEVSIVATSTDDVDPRRVSIGRPFHNLEAYVLDEHLQPVPPGVPGELCLGGVGLARGYLGRPELTAEKFIPHPFSSAPGARL
ncbi:non-ribosomal peptide synthetase, partial [Archangium violaceum]|uniref:non-ribosomal peptide synthetase n=1 Tax=Archangium violaceum TaxID=83451 RepID=UPI0005BD5AAA